LRREDLGNNAAALARLHQDRPFNPPSTLVQTTDPTDRVVASADHPEEVEAVHGPYIVTLDLSDMTNPARGHPTWAYRVQRTALEAAGATIVPAKGMAPDPVTPGPPPPPEAFSWRTSDHVPPSWARYADPLLYAAAFLTRHRFVMMPVLIIGSIFLGTTRRRPLLIPLGIGFAVVNLIFGTWVSNALIARLGAEGRATITGSYGTSTVYNNHNVRGYDVLLKTTDGRVVETNFEDDEFNVYPSHNATTYPGKGSMFNVRYLQSFPTTFVILGEDDSPWAHDLKCRRLGSARAQAEAKLQFAPDVKNYTDALDIARAAERDAGCEP
jgi:hypothetical protein